MRATIPSFVALGLAAIACGGCADDEAAEGHHGAKPRVAAAKSAKPGLVRAFARRGDIYARSLHGRKRRLTSGSAVDREPVASPNGKQVVFTRASGPRGRDVDLYIVNVQSGAVRPLTNLAGEETHPTWSPDGKQIAFLSFAPTGFGYGYAIESVDADGGDLAILYEKDGVIIRSPRWLPSNNIAFEIGVEDTFMGGTQYSQLIMNADGSDVRSP